MFLLLCGLCWFGRNNFSVDDDSPILLSESYPSLLYRLNRGFVGKMHVGVLFSGQTVLKLRIKSTGTNSKRDLQGRTVEA